MNNRQRTKRGFTLVEMLVVIAIVAVLATLIVGVASRIESREKEKLGKNTLALLTTALAQFHDYGFSYKHSDYTAFGFPLDCSGFSTAKIQTMLGEAIGVGAGSVQISGVVDPNEVTYLFLSMVPASKQTLGKIDKKLIVSSTTTIEIGGARYQLFKVIDPWGETLRYDYYNELGSSTERVKSKRTFPLVISAGPDRKFGTDDDITSRD